VQCWQGLGEVPGDWGSAVVTIGVFDGVHLGHQRIVSRAGQIAAASALSLVVVTFDPHPVEVVRPGAHPPLLCTLRRRVQLMDGLGADAVCVIAFTQEFSRLGPDEFIRVALAERLHARHVVVGENFRFGHGQQGDVAMLADLGDKYDFTAEGVPLLTQDGVTISSSTIRQRLAAGDVAGAARGLGRPHRVEGVVVRGAQRGRELGIPTANTQPPPHTAIPGDGVYAGWLVRLDAGGLESERWPAAISVGTNPQFDGQHRVVEAHALDRDDLDLYGARVAVDFVARLRGMATFASVDDLVTQMHRDIGQARDLLAP
jgi:riboflavin kinase/FMN adenylyltransferase